MNTPSSRRRGINRRNVIKTAATVGQMAGVGPLLQTRPAYAAKKTLKILQWSHFVPAYDKWFNNEYVKEWGDKNDTEVTVDNINLGLITSRAAAEVSAQKGHDLVLFLSPPAIEDIRKFLLENPTRAYCDDCLSSLLKIKPRQAVQQKTNALAKTYPFQRLSGQCTRCKAIKLVVGQRSTNNTKKGANDNPSAKPVKPNPPTTIGNAIFSEDEVKKALECWLRAQGWSYLLNPVGIVPIKPLRKPNPRIKWTIIV